MRSLSDARVVGFVGCRCGWNRGIPLRWWVLFYFITRTRFETLVASFCVECDSMMVTMRM